MTGLNNSSLKGLNPLNLPNSSDGSESIVVDVGSYLGRIIGSIACVLFTTVDKLCPRAIETDLVAGDEMKFGMHLLRSWDILRLTALRFT